MIETLPALLLRLIEAGDRACLSGREAKPFFGKDFERLLARQVLVEQAPLECWSACSMCECDVAARSIQVLSNLLVAACPLDASQDLILDQHDVRIFEINRGNFVREIIQASALVGDADELAQHVWRLPFDYLLPIVLVVDEMAARNDALVVVLRYRLDNQQAVVLLPSGVPATILRKLQDAGFQSVVTSKILRTDWSLDKDALVGGGNPARLIIHRAARSVELDRIAVRLTDQPFRIFLQLVESAQAGRGGVEGIQLERAFWGDLEVPSGWLIRDVIRKIRDAFRKAIPGIDALNFISSSRSPTLYAVTLQADEIQLLG